MPTITLAALQARIQQRKEALGLQDTPADTEAMRNKGANRTPRKRELLRRAEARARSAGARPVPAYY